MPENTRGPKVHDPELTAHATLVANLEGMRLSGQPWQEDCAGASTVELIEVVHPLLDGAASIPVDCADCAEPCDECVDADVDEDAADPDVVADDVVRVPETKDELRAALTELGVDAPSKATKADLEALYADALCDEAADGADLEAEH